MPGECCDIRFHWQKKFPEIPGKTVGTMVLFGGTLDPSLMHMRDLKIS